MIAMHFCCGFVHITNYILDHCCHFIVRFNLRYVETAIFPQFPHLSGCYRYGEIADHVVMPVAVALSAKRCHVAEIFVMVVDPLDEFFKLLMGCLNV